MGKGEMFSLFRWMGNIVDQKHIDLEISLQRSHVQVCSFSSIKSVVCARMGRLDWGDDKLAIDWSVALSAERSVSYVLVIRTAK